MKGTKLPAVFRKAFRALDEPEFVMSLQRCSTKLIALDFKSLYQANPCFLGSFLAPIVERKVDYVAIFSDTLWYIFKTICQGKWCKRRFVFFWVRLRPQTKIFRVHTDVSKKVKVCAITNFPFLLSREQIRFDGLENKEEFFFCT